ncbi:MAG: DUF4190 domain-containing protein [Sedimentisphaerales bacterium]|nr:DUF4190 domain-containing protein [Sedimentisphaerales bacterium]
MSNNSDKIIEVGQESTEKQVEATAQNKVKKICRSAKVSFFSGVSIVPLAIVSVILAKTVIYSPPLEAFNSMLLFLCLILLPVSVISGIVALVQIALKRKELRGWILAIAGIAISIVSFAIYGYEILRIAFDKMMA